MHRPKVLIAGAGPAGMSTSLWLSSFKIAHTISDKSVFPRDKICGDALSGKVVHELNKLNPSFINEICDNKNSYTGSFGVRFFSPDGKCLDVPFSNSPEKLKQPPGFIATRLDFDNFLFGKADESFADIRQGIGIEKIERKGNLIRAHFNNKENILYEDFDIVIGAEGDRSIVSKELLPLAKNPEHYCAGLRVYYENISGTHAEHFIELHFLKEILPGYFWIFPMKNGRANVGIGMLSKYVSKKKINLRKMMEEIIQSHPVISKRFKNAQAVTPVHGWGLPLGSARRKISGDNFLLCGDAASLIDPFTGEGIGNAIVSGRIAAETIAKAMDQNNFSGKFLKQYDENVYRQLGSELKISHSMQKLARYEFLFNFVVGKAIRNETLRETFTCMFEDMNLREKLSKPSFYAKLLFDRK